MKNRITQLPVCIAILLLLITCNKNAVAQSDWKNWNAISIDLGITQKLNAKFNHMRSYEISDNFRNSFNQTAAQLDYDFNKRINLMSGAMLTDIAGTAVSTRRFYVRGSYRLPIANRINWTNSLQFEKHSPEEKRFDYRIVYISRIGLKKRLEFLRLAPSIAYWLYYNIGGAPLQYYNSEGTKIATQTADGLHRYRIYFNLNSKISKNIAFTLYYMHQQEFNLGNSLQNINVTNPSTGRVSRRFDNYNVAGATLSFNFNLFTKK